MGFKGAIPLQRTAFLTTFLLMNPILIDIPMPIRTPRLLIRPPVAGEGRILNEAILESFNELHRWMPWAEKRPTLEESEESVRRATAKWILREDLRMTIHDRTTDRIVGSTGLHRFAWDIPSFEIGYWARTSDAGKGYITEATHALTLYAFRQFKAKRVEVRCNADNAKSAAIPKRLGFELEGRLRNEDTHVREGAGRDKLIFARVDEAGLPPLDVSWG